MGHIGTLVRVRTSTAPVQCMWWKPHRTCADRSLRGCPDLVDPQISDAEVQASGPGCVECSLLPRHWQAQKVASCLPTRPTGTIPVMQSRSTRHTSGGADVVSSVRSISATRATMPWRDAVCCKLLRADQAAGRPCGTCTRARVDAGLSDVFVLTGARMMTQCRACELAQVLDSDACARWDKCARTDQEREPLHDNISTNYTSHSEQTTALRRCKVVCWTDRLSDR